EACAEEAGSGRRDGRVRGAHRVERRERLARPDVANEAARRIERQAHVPGFEKEAGHDGRKAYHHGMCQVVPLLTLVSHGVEGLAFAGARTAGISRRYAA